MVIARPPGTWTYADLALLPDDGTRYEIIDGTLYEVSGPKPAHAVAIMALIELLLPIIRRLDGTLLTAALDIFFAGADPVQPDLFAFSPGRRARFSDRGVEGPPDLMIEVLSPSNRRHDTVRKRALYARGGVREYWIVDPEAASIKIIGADGETVQRAIATAGKSLTLRSPLLGEMAADPAALFPVATGA